MWSGVCANKLIISYRFKNKIIQRLKYSIPYLHCLQTFIYALAIVTTTKSQRLTIDSGRTQDILLVYLDDWKDIYVQYYCVRQLDLTLQLSINVDNYKVRSSSLTQLYIYIFSVIQVNKQFYFCTGNIQCEFYLVQASVHSVCCIYV